MEHNPPFNDPQFPHEVEKNDWPWIPVESPIPVFLPADGLPRISIITPSFNQGKFIEETIRSVLLQNYPNLEYIIIDGGSSDATPEIIAKYAPWISYWISESDGGQSHAINKGIEKATGDWIAWINADDIYMQGALLKIGTTIALSANGISWIVGATVFTDVNLREIGRFEPSLYTAAGRDMNYERMGWIDFVCTKRSGIALPQPSSFWRRDIVVDAGGIDESLRYAMDHELYGRLAYQGSRPVLIEEPLAYFRTHQEQKTADFPLAFWREELSVVNSWVVRIKNVEKQKLEKYAAWLAKEIRYYPYRVSYQSMKSRVRSLLWFTFGPVFKKLKQYIYGK